MEVTPDEWLAEHLGDRDLCKPLFSLLVKLGAGKDSIWVAKEGRIEKKLWDISRSCSNWSPTQLAITRYFFGVWRLDPARYIRLDIPAGSDLPTSLASSVHKDDAEIVLTCLGTSDRYLVTTDNPLREAVEGHEGMRGVLLSEFQRKHGVTPLPEAPQHSY